MLQTILITWSIVAGLVWIGICGWILKVNQALVNFANLRIQELSDWPRLSIIVPACNEATTLSTAMNKLLSVDYPNFEIILINDRSTDNTGEIVKQLSLKDNRIVPVDIQKLPRGWLGKVHALHQGTQIATGTFLLFTDADTLFDKKDTLKKAIAYTESEKVDHLVLIPWYRTTKAFILEMVLLSMSMVGLCLFKLPNDELNSKKSNGIGQFNLIRKKIFDKTPGFDWLKMEAIDDIGLSVLMKEAGAKNKVFLGVDNISIYWYPNYFSLMKGLEKNSYAVFHYQALRFLVANIIILLLLFGPLLVFILPYKILYLWPIMLYLVMLVTSYKISRSFKRAWWTIFFTPISLCLFITIFWRSAVLFWIRGGIYWRGKFYSGKLLRKNQRVKM